MEDVKTVTMLTLHIIEDMVAVNVMQKNVDVNN